MTILPKKKQTKDKNEPSTTEHSHTNHSIPNVPSAEQNINRPNRHPDRRPNSPPQRWGSPTPREDNRLGPSHDPGGLFEEFGPNHEQTTSSHNINKRRHRSSPHRNVRKHRVWESNQLASTSSHAHRLPNLGNYRSEPSTSHTQELETGDSLTEENLVEELEGYNSGDEYVAQQPVPENIEQLEIWFERAMKEKTGSIIKKMREDGACLFRAVSDQVYGDQEMHDIVRANCIDYMSKNADFFRHYVTEDFETYLNRKRVASSHGNHIEIQALSEIYNRPIEVYQYSIEPINVFHGSYKTDNEPIRLSYHGDTHYNSVVDPRKATVGVGLGLPGFQPGQAEKNLMLDAKQASESYHIESTMLQDKLRETDWEVTQESIEEQVARESYLQWLSEQEKNANKQSSNPNRTASATCSSASQSQAMWDSTTLSKPAESRGTRSPRNRTSPGSGQNSPNRLNECTVTSGQLSPKPCDNQQLHLPGAAVLPGSPRPSTTSGISQNTTEGAVAMETSSIMNQHTDMLSYSGWDEDDILAQVIAQSQKEYLDQLKRKANSSNSSSPCGGASPNHSGTFDNLPPDPPTKSKNLHSNSKNSNKTS